MSVIFAMMSRDNNQLFITTIILGHADDDFNTGNDDANEF